MFWCRPCVQGTDKDGMNGPNGGKEGMKGTGARKGEKKRANQTNRTKERLPPSLLLSQEDSSGT
jgi:hypothetical protein